MSHSPERGDRSRVDSSVETAPHFVTQVASEAPRIDGIVVGLLAEAGPDEQIKVAFPGMPTSEPLPASSTVGYDRLCVGGEVALTFIDGDAHRPVVLGPIRRPEIPATRGIETSRARRAPRIEGDEQRLTVTADREIEFRCGKASLTLTRAGKIVMRGSHILSRSSGMNRIKGASVQIN